QNPKQCLSITCEIGSVLGFMPVDPFETIAIIEEKRFVLPFINQQAAKKAIQCFKELIAFFLVQMNQPITSVISKSMSLLLECRRDFTIHKTLAGKDQRYVALFVEKHLTRSKGLFVRGPACINLQFGHRVCTRNIKRLVLYAGDHCPHNGFTFFGGSLANNSDQARHTNSDAHAKSGL